MSDKLFYIALRVRNKLRPFVEKNNHNFSRNFAGACAVSSFLLYDVYKHRKIKTEIVYGEFGDEGSHVFLSKKIKQRIFVIDITASQFGLSSVYIGPLRYPYKPIVSGYRNVKKIVSDWPDQSPKLFNKEVANMYCELVNEKESSSINISKTKRLQGYSSQAKV